MINNQLNHVAFILDGNKRWAKRENLPLIKGYTAGFENIKKIVYHCLERNIPNLTLFTLSSENFKRTSINLIYEIIYNNFNSLIEEFTKKKNIKINIFGSKNNLPDKILDIFFEVEKIKTNDVSLNLNLAFNYGFTNEIKDVLEKFKKNIDNVNLDDKDQIKKLFYLSDYPDPDLLIRTGGYKRLSNFIMYNLTYTELFFTNTLWPEFTPSELDNIINEFLNIKRKYGL